MSSPVSKPVSSRCTKNFLDWRRQPRILSLSLRFLVIREPRSTHHVCDVKEGDDVGPELSQSCERNLLPQSVQNLELNRGGGRRASYIRTLGVG